MILTTKCIPVLKSIIYAILDLVILLLGCCSRLGVVLDVTSHSFHHQRKAVTQLKTASALGRLMALSDGNLYLLDSDMLNTIGSGPKMKNVTVFCVNENPNTQDPFTVQVELPFTCIKAVWFCLAKRWIAMYRALLPLVF